MSMAKKCDSCGKYYEKYGGKFFIKATQKYVMLDDIKVESPKFYSSCMEGNFDLCPECQQKVADVLGWKSL